MIRFAPDSLLEGLLRPIVMALPQPWVYSELTAPDFRYVFLIGMLLFWFIAGFLLKRQWSANPRHGVLSGVCLLAFVPWLLTGGNGRYFIAYLALVGPLCVALAYASSASRNMKVALVAFFLLMQGHAILTNSPWNPFETFEWGRWTSRDYFHLDVAPVSKDEGVTYVSLANQTNSLIIPLFPESSRWINLTSFQGRNFLKNDDRVVAQARSKLASTSPLRLVVQAQPRMARPEDGLPDDQARRLLDRYVDPFGLRLQPGMPCLLLRSSSLAATLPILASDAPAQISRLRQHAGFWVCPMTYVGRSELVEAKRPWMNRGERSISAVERACPRLFPPGQVSFNQLSYGIERIYTESDATLVYVADEDAVYVSFFRALNPQRIGSGEELRKASFQVKCDQFVSREGLPWLRNI
ncbi:MAG: hypothetical protein ACM3VZ_01090 [Acidobacteriota bacterium]